VKKRPWKRRGFGPTPIELVPAGFLAPPLVGRSNPAHGNENHVICDCCVREADNNLGWAHISINGASDGKQIMPDDNRDLCEICWSPLHTLMKKGYEEAREKRSSTGEQDVWRAHQAQILWLLALRCP
jgi:hypothetical protein